ncbi:hypothetical protein D3C76_1077480 [compost metagenome]
MIERKGLLTRFQRRQCFTNRHLVECGQPEALDGTSILAELQQFAGNHLTFAIGIGGDDDGGGFTEQALDDFELCRSLGFDLDHPLRGNDR